MKQTIILLAILLISSAASAQLRMTPEVRKCMVSPTEAMIKGNLYDVDTSNMEPDGNWWERLRTDTIAIKYEVHLIDEALKDSTAVRFAPEPAPNRDDVFYVNPRPTPEAHRKQLMTKKQKMLANLEALRAR